MTRIAHIRVYPTDWRSGCMGLTLEQEGLYMRICMFIAETSRRVPSDDSEAARMLNVQTRNYRRVLGELLRLGKVTRHENGYGNDRIEHERRQAEKAADRKPSAETRGQSEGASDPGSGGQDCALTSEVTPNYSGYNGVITPLAAEIRQQNQCPFIEPESEPKKEPPTPKGVSASPTNELKIERPFPSNVRQMETYGTNPPGWETVNGRLNPVGDERAKLLSHFGGDETAFGIALEKTLEKMKQSPRRYHAGRARELLLREAESNYRSKRYAETRAKPAADAPKTVSQVLKERQAAREAANGATVQ